MFRRVIALILCLSMLMTTVPVSAEGLFPADTTAPAVTGEVVEVIGGEQAEGPAEEPTMAETVAPAAEPADDVTADQPVGEEPADPETPVVTDAPAEI